MCLGFNIIKQTPIDIMNSEETYPKLVADTDEDQESVNAPEDNESSAFSEKNVRLGKGRLSLVVQR